MSRKGRERSWRGAESGCFRKLVAALLACSRTTDKILKHRQLASSQCHRLNSTIRVRVRHRHGSLAFCHSIRHCMPEYATAFASFPCQIDSGRHIPSQPSHSPQLRNSYHRLITARASSTATADTLDLLILFQLLPRHTTDACAVEVGLLSLNAPQTAKLLITLLLPLGNEVGVCISILEQPIV